jgi:hypothetical protein
MACFVLAQVVVDSVVGIALGASVFRWSSAARHPKAKLKSTTALEVNTKGENATETDVLEHLASYSLAVVAMARKAGLQGKNGVQADAAITPACAASLQLEVLDSSHPPHSSAH